MYSTTRTWLLIAALAATMAVTVGAAADQPPTAPEEQWFVIRMSGSNVGTASERWSRTASENADAPCFTNQLGSRGSLPEVMQKSFTASY